MTQMTNDKIVGVLMDTADQIGASQVRATVPDDQDGWTTISVYQPNMWEDAPKGWGVRIEHGSL